MGTGYAAWTLPIKTACSSVIPYLSKQLVSIWSKSRLQPLANKCTATVRKTVSKSVSYISEKIFGKRTYRYRRPPRRWYVRQHKRGRRVRSARVCQRLPKPPVKPKSLYTRSMDYLFTIYPWRKKKKPPSEGAAAYLFPAEASRYGGNSKEVRKGGVRVRFDTDSKPLGVDSGATTSMTNNKRDYVPGTMRRINTPVIGIGTTKAVWKGTVRWSFQDDKGVPFEFELHDVLYVPTIPFRILSPQHWAACVESKYGYCIGTIDRHESVLYWNGGENTRHIKLSDNSNIALMQTAPSYDNYAAFLSEVEQDPATEFENFICFPATSGNTQETRYVSDDEDEEERPLPPLAFRRHGPDHDTGHASEQTTPVVETVDPNEEHEFEGEEHELEGATTRDTPVNIDFGDDAAQHGLQNPDKPLSDDQAELMRWHYRLGHTSFNKLKLLAAIGDIPTKLQNCRVPICPACTYGKLTKRGWRTKQPPNKIEPVPIKAPGDCVSVDQLESTTPGFIAQLKGFLTSQRYSCATVFTDHHSRLSRVYVQKNLSADENLKSKRLWEAYCRSHGVTTKHYHADNGHFADLEWLADVAKKGQTITFCGVNSHFQNGISEKRIRDLQELARTEMLDAKSRWSKAIDPSLWPYALRHANDVHSVSPQLTGPHKGKSPSEVFTQLGVRPNLKHYHPFGCPVYCLQNKLQASQSLNKWLPRARLGIYLGFSPTHARSVALVLNPQTGLVSPQYHVKFDDLWETVDYPRNKLLDHSEWQSKAGITGKRASLSQDAKQRRAKKAREG